MLHEVSEANADPGRRSQVRHAQRIVRHSTIGGQCGLPAGAGLRCTIRSSSLYEDYEVIKSQHGWIHLLHSL